MLPEGRELVVRRKIFEELDVGNQAGARKESLKQIVAEQGVLRYLAREGGFERVYIVNSLACVGSLCEKILVDVRNRSRIRVNAAGSSEDHVENGLFPITRERGHHPRLQHAVPFHHAPFASIEPRPIQG